MFRWLINMSIGSMLEAQTQFEQMQSYQLDNELREL